MRNIKEDARNTIFIDLDGTIVIHNYDPEDVADVIIPNSLKFLQLHRNDCLVLTTSRSMLHTTRIVDTLEGYGIHFTKIITDLPTGYRLIINDSTTNTPKAIALHTIRNLGVYGKPLY